MGAPEIPELILNDEKGVRLFLTIRTQQPEFHTVS